MISDIISQASKDIQNYLINPTDKDVYSNDILDCIEDLVEHMNSLIAYLDKPLEQSIKNIEKHVKFSGNYGIGVSTIRQARVKDLANKMNLDDI